MHEIPSSGSENSDYVPNLHLDIFDRELDRLFDEGQKDNRTIENINMDQIDLIDRKVADLLAVEFKAKTSGDPLIMPAIQELVDRSTALKKFVNSRRPGTYLIR